LRRRPSLSAAFVALAVVVLVASAALSGCGTSVNLSVDVGRQGAGTVTLLVTFPPTTATQIEDLKAGLPVADLRAAGWVVAGPKPGPGGSTVVSASHSFSDLSQVPALVADVAGNGTESQRPFRLSVSEQPSFLQDRFVATGDVDLRCSLSCFGDPQLAKNVGYALGLAPSEMRQLMGPDPAKDIAFRVEVLLPGKVTSSNAAAHSSGGTLVWVPVLGNATTLQASSKKVDVARVRALYVAINAGALVVLTTAAYLLWRRRRRPKSRLAYLTVPRNRPPLPTSWR
jgi:hypothetical protein